MTLGLTCNIRAKSESFTVLADFADAPSTTADGAKLSAPVVAPTAPAAPASRSVYHERCFLVNDHLSSLRHSIASKLQPACDSHSRDVRRDFVRQVSRALESIKSRRTIESTTTCCWKRPKREDRMEKPMFVTTVKSGVFLEPPPEVAVLLGLRKSSSTERLSNRKQQPSKGADVVYSFASKPRLVRSTAEPPTPPNGASIANRRRIFKRHVADEAALRDVNGCTMTSTAAAAAADGSIQFGGNTMHDRRVARGSNFASLRLNAPTTENVLSRQAEARRRAAVRQRAQIRARKLRNRTPPPVDGRKHGEMQTDKYWEELTDREMKTSAIGCQTDSFSFDDDDDDDDDDEDFQFPSSVSNITTARTDAQTQLDESDLILQLHSVDDFDGVRGNSVIVSVVNKILKEAILEINAEIEKFQNTKEITKTTRLPASSMDNEYFTISFTKHELCSLLRNFNAENKEHVDWPVLDFEETIYNSLVDDVFEHLRRLLRNLDFLANITKNQLELRKNKLSNSTSPPSSPLKQTETAKSVQPVIKITSDSNSRNLEEIKTNTRTSLQEVEESDTQKNRTETTSGLLAAEREGEILSEKLSRNANNVNNVSPHSDLIEVENFSKSSSDTSDDKYSVKKEIDKAEETGEISIPVNSPDIGSSNSTEAMVSKTMQIKNQSFPIVNDKELKEKTEPGTSSDLLSSEEVSTNTKSTELENDTNNKLINSQIPALAEKSKSEETRENTSEIQKKQIPSASLTPTEIPNNKMESNRFTNNLKLLSDNVSIAESNEITEKMPAVVPHNDTKNKNILVQKNKSKIESKSKEDNAENKMNQNTSKDIMSKEDEVQNKSTSENTKDEEKLSSPNKSNLSTKNIELSEQQLHQAVSLKSSEENNGNTLEDPFMKSTNDAKTDIPENKSVDKTAVDNITVTGSTERIQTEISEKHEDQNDEEKTHFLESKEEIKNEDVTLVKSDNERDVTEEVSNSFQSVNSHIQKITAEHSETNKTNESATDSSFVSENNQKIPKDSSDTQLLESIPENNNANREMKSSVSESSQRSIEENTTLSIDDYSRPDTSEVLENQTELSTASKNVDNVNKEQTDDDKVKANENEGEKLEDASNNMQDTKNIHSQGTVLDDSETNAGDKFSNNHLLLENSDTKK